MTAPTYIANSKRVIDHFGHWPSFHDATVVAYEAASQDAARVCLTLRTWTMTSEVDSKGYFVLKDHALVTFYFTGLSDLKMDDFATDNILFSMKLSQSAGDTAFHVELDSVMDKSGSFSALSGEILSVVSCS